MFESWAVWVVRTYFLWHCCGNKVARCLRRHGRELGGEILLERDYSSGRVEYDSDGGGTRMDMLQEIIELVGEEQARHWGILPIPKVKCVPKKPKPVSCWISGYLNAGHDSTTARTMDEMIPHVKQCPAAHATRGTRLKGNVTSDEQRNLICFIKQNLAKNIVKTRLSLRGVALRQLWTRNLETGSRDSASWR